MLIHKCVRLNYFDDENETMFDVFIFSEADETTSLERHRGYGAGTFWSNDAEFSFDTFAEAVKYYKDLGYEIDWEDIWWYEYQYRSTL